MNDLSFKESIIKYGLLDNESNINSHIYYEKITKDIKLYLDCPNYVSYGQINVNIKNPSNFVIFLNDIKIASLTTTQNLVMPCAFTEGSYIDLKGTCDTISIDISGAKLKNKNLLKFNNIKKFIVRDCGECEICNFSSKDDILTGLYSSVNTYDKIIDAQGIFVNNSNYLAYVSEYLNNVYLYTEVDNYASKQLITSSVDDARILPLSSENAVIIVWIKDSQLFYKKMAIGSEAETNTVDIQYDNCKLAKSLSVLTYDSHTSGAIFGVNFDDGSMSLFKMSSGEFVEILSQKAETSKVVLNGTTAEVYDLSDYTINVSKYQLGDEVTKITQTKTIYNADDIIKIGDVYLFYHNNLISEVDIDNL